MPALTQQIGNIGKSSFLWRSFQPSGTVLPEDKVLVPTGFAAISGASGTSGSGNLDLSKVKAFFTGSLLPVEDIKAIRLRATVMGEAIAESDVKKAFNAYCDQIAKKKVVYHYNADDSPFDVNFKGNSNCQGRAKGFLQLMAILGVSKEALNYCKIGGGPSDGDKKICQKGDDDINTGNIYQLDRVEVPAPNAVRIELQSGKPVVVRTPREPFANHYATFLEVSGLGLKYWDPLERVAYQNGFPDYFTSYASDGPLTVGLKDWSVECLVNPDNTKERIYLLPPASQFRSVVLKTGFGTKGTVGSSAFYNQTAFKDVESSLREMTEGTEPQIAMIVDESDWGGKTGNHPPVVLAMFPNLK
ncbi:MAG: hypothetical protein ABIP20_19360 [Chthoniobacteraceae bacterium]